MTETSAPLVSVMMIVNNGERFLIEALDSVFYQTFRDFEVIVVDDGSTDDTPKILSAYSSREPKLTVVTNQDKSGIPKSRNIACRQSRGKYLAVLDADDVSLPDRLKRQVLFLENNSDIAAVGSAGNLIDEDSAIQAKIAVPSVPAHVKWFLNFDNAFIHSSVMVRRDTAASYGFYSEDLPLAEDYDLFARMSLQCKLANLPEILVHYRTYGQNITLKKRAQLDQIAGQIAQRLISHHLGESISFDDVDLIRRPNWRGRPEDVACIVHAYELLQFLFLRFRSHAEMSRQEASLVREDLALRSLKLAYQMMHRSPHRALSAAVRSVYRSPKVVVTLARNMRRTIQPSGIS